MFSLAVAGLSAYQQALMLVGALFCLGVGGLIAGHELLWRLRARRVDGTLIGVREKSKNMFFSVYRYELAPGQPREATSSVGSTGTRGRDTGRTVRLLVFAEHPEDVCEAGSYVGETVGWAFVLAGLWVLHVSLTASPTTGLTWLMLGSLAAYGAWRLRPAASTGANGRSFAEWRAARREARRAATAAVPVQRIEDILARPEMIEQQRQRRRSAAIAAPLLTLLGIAALAWGAQEAKTTAQLLASGARAEGSVVALHAQPSGSPPAYHPVVYFVADGGATVQFQDRIGSNPPAYRPGTVVHVLYRKDAPATTAMIDRGVWTILPAALAACLGILLIVAGVLASATLRAPARKS